MASGGKRGAGERVLESRHVIGLFMLMLLFSAVFFTLGYVMGRNQYDGQVRAATTQHTAPDTAIGSKLDPESKRSSGASPSTNATPPNSDWEFYSADKQKQTDDHLRPVSPASSAPKPSAKGNSNGQPATVASDVQNAPLLGGSYTVQVTAVRRESDALDLAKRLQKKRFPAFVLSSQGNKYYRVQVGPYADQKSAEVAKKGLESAGFRAIVKHG
jgi:cell division septation protein DedD